MDMGRWEAPAPTPNGKARPAWHVLERRCMSRSGMASLGSAWQARLPDQYQQFVIQRKGE